MVESTIWSHIEKLAAEKEITLEDIKHLEPAKDWGDISSAIYSAIDKYGAERLKPLYEATGEKYDYNLIRLARVQYSIENKDDVF